jgi:hypothetical protein
MVRAGVMNRRAFLRLIGGAGLGATVDRKYFFAPAAGWASGGIVAPGAVYVVGESGTECQFRVQLPKPGSYPLEFSKLGYFMIAKHEIKKLDAVWLNYQIQIAARGPVIRG